MFRSRVTGHSRMAKRLNFLTVLGGSFSPQRAASAAAARRPADGDLTGRLGDRDDGWHGGREGVRATRRASRGEQAPSSADPGAEVALRVPLALWLVHCSLI